MLINLTKRRRTGGAIPPDYAGTGAVTLMIDGVVVLTGSLPNAVGNTSNTNPSRHRIGAGVNKQSSNIISNRQIFLPKLASIGELASMVGYAEAVPL